MAPHPSVTRDPHQGDEILHAGAPLAGAAAAMVLLHGRGASAEDILGLTDHLPRERVAYVAPQAAGHTWYPERFTEPIERNEPWLSSALALVGRIIDEIIAAGIPAERIGLLGFSQGACLALEFAARHPRRYGGVFALSGGLIGPPGTVWDDRGSLGGTPVFLGCSDVDSHIPAERVIESGERMRELGAEVEVRLYPGMGHTINRDELDIIRRGVERMVAADPAPLE